MEHKRPNRTRAKRTVGAGVLLLFSVTFSAAAPSQQATDAKPGSAMGMSGMSGDMGQAMMRNMQQMQSMPMSGDTDRDFATMMRMHHQGGIEMAQAELKSGRDPQLRAMAQKTIDAQRKEIDELDQWLARHKQGGAAPGKK